MTELRSQISWKFKCWVPTDRFEFSIRVILQKSSLVDWFSRSGRSRTKFKAVYNKIDLKDWYYKTGFRLRVKVFDRWGLLKGLRSFKVVSERIKDKRQKEKNEIDEIARTSWVNRIGKTTRTVMNWGTKT